MRLREFEDAGMLWHEAMHRGDFEEAWRQTDRIELDRRARELVGAFTRKPHYLRWNGTPFEGREVLVRCEHGLGDTLQFIRYVPQIKQRARTVTILVQPQLVDLLQGSADFGDVRNGWTQMPPPPHDIEIEVMELPYAFRSTLSTVPAAVPYLPLANVHARAAQLPALTVGSALRVGLLWSASDWDTSRSIPIEALEPLADLGGVEFYSLQQGESAQDSVRAGFPITPLSLFTKEIGSAAAAMLELDVIITVDSMAAHLAGALGRPVWVLLQHECDWRWMRSRADSPWYPSMRLFRQHRPRDWRFAVQAAAAALVDVADDLRARARQVALGRRR
jgi:hypothetical protein